MESGAKRLLRKASERLELPADVIAGLPKLEITGYTELMLEHHSGIRDYSQELIVIDVPLGAIRLEGLNLSIYQMNSERIVIRGTICRVTLEGEVAS